MKKILSIFLISISSIVIGYGQSSSSKVHLLNTEIGVNNSNYFFKIIDLDLDGDDDIYFQNGSTKGWKENLGNNIFTTYKAVAPEVNSTVISDIGDIDGDGDYDLLGSGSGMNWIENVGNQNFSIFYPAIYQTTSNFNPPILADINSNGRNDILFTANNVNYTGISKISYIENNGNGMFSTTENIVFSTYSGDAQKHFVNDIDSDGDLDIFVTYRYPEKISWFENLGNGQFGTENILNSISGSWTGDMKFSDLDNDNDIDIITLANNGILISSYEYLGNGSYGTEIIVDTVNGGCCVLKSLELTDIDGDGLDDIVYSEDNSVFWYKNLGGTNFGPQTLIGTYQSNISRIETIRVSDSDNDGDIDIYCVFRRPSSGDSYNSILLLVNDGVGNFAQKVIYRNHKSSMNIPQVLLADDFNNDGIVDIVSATEYTNLEFYEGIGNKEFKEKKIISSIPFNILSGAIAYDHDADGDLDIISINYTQSIFLHENLGGGNFAPASGLLSANTNNLSEIKLLKIDNDSLPDLVFSSSNLISWSKNLGSGNWGQVVTIQSAPNSFNDINTFDIADTDNDGDLDLIYTLDGLGDIIFSENLGNLTFGTNQILYSFANGSYFADVNGDGLSDIITKNTSQNTLLWYQNLGNNTFDLTGTIIETNYSFPFREINLHDVDNDGDIDIISGNHYFENLGSGNFVSKRDLFNFSNVHNIENTKIIDIDNNGVLDILFRSSGEIGWAETNFNNIYNISGQIFYDANQNQIKDSTELGISGLRTFLQPNALGSFSGVDGSFYYAVDSGAYTVSYNQLQHWGLTTDSSSYNVNLTLSNPTKDSLLFGFYPDTIFTDLEPVLTGGFPRCNDTVTYWINYSNIGTTIPSGFLNLQLNDSITFVSSSLVPDSINGNNLYWSFDSLFFFSSNMITLQVQMPPFTNMGDTLSSYLTIHELDNNNIVYSQSDTLKQILVCAYDPNDKSVNPFGYGPEGYISPNQELEYLIRFQNTGNDTAKTIIIEDYLDVNLNWNSFKPLASSHNVNSQIDGNGKIKFIFNNIMLPDSATDETNSKGFVKYQINPIAGLPPHTRIRNNAEIYFDFNPAIITNYTLNTIECYGTPQPNITYNFPYLNAGVTGNYSYQWYLNDTTIIKGATSDTLIPTISGNYSVEITDSNYCSTKSVPYNYIAVSISELNLLNTIVFPNPFTSSTTILFDKTLDGIYDLLIYDIVGKQVQRINNITGNKIEINKKDLGTGLFLSYLVNNKTREKIFIEKLIIQ